MIRSAYTRNPETGRAEGLEDDGDSIFCDRRSMPDYEAAVAAHRLIVGFVALACLAVPVAVVWAVTNWTADGWGRSADTLHTPAPQEGSASR